MIRKINLADIAMQCLVIALFSLPYAGDGDFKMMIQFGDHDILCNISVLGSPCRSPHHVSGHLQDGPRLRDVRLAGGRLHLPALLGPRDRLHAPAHAPPHRPLRRGHTDLQILPPRA